MKIFGKRPKTKPNTPTTPPERSGIEDVPSYFSDEKGQNSTKKGKKAKETDSNKAQVMTDIDVLLKMDPKELNAKQRRVLRRHKEREQEEKECTNEKEDSSEKSMESDDKKREEINDSPDMKDEQEQDVKESNKLVDTSDSSEQEPVSLEGLNSKERRKLLRKLKREGKDTNNIGTGTMGQELPKDESETNTLSEKRPFLATDDQVPRKKSKKSKDWSHLSKEERDRREHQRMMQAEAARRRANGEDLKNGHKHPLNSERRRANRRKPGKSGAIAQRKRMERNGQRDVAEYNAKGFEMRRNKSVGY